MADGEPDQNYIAKCRIGALKYGLVLHVPPRPGASWWYPGSTLLLCYTRTAAPVEFLPENDHHI
jgi:hypothetical protein